MKAEDTVMKSDELKAIKDAIESHDHTYTISIILAICEAIAEEQARISFKKGQEDKDKEWDDWRMEYIPNALFNAKLEGRKEYHKFMLTPCPHFVADRAYIPSPCPDCYEAKLKEWGIE